MIIGVYGTLKNGHRAHYLLGEDAQLVSEGYHEIPYIMMDAGSFPALIPSEKNHKIHLEIYRIKEENIKEIDHYEGYPHLFNKEKINIDNNEVWIYTFNKYREGFNEKYFKKIVNGKFE